MNRKRRHCVLHVIKRARERFDLQLNGADVELIGKRIRKGRSRFLGNQSNSKTFHMMQIGGIKMIVLYDKKRSVPVTIMPLRL